MPKVATWLVLASICGTQLACSFAANLAAPRITVENVVALPPSAGQQRFRRAQAAHLRPSVRMLNQG